MEVYFDEAGYTGENLDDLMQSNLLLAAVAIPAEIDEAFWRSAAQAWEIAGAVLSVPPGTVELKGADIYGGKGRFKDADGSSRLRIIEAIFDALVQQRIRVYWDGLAKHVWKNQLHALGNTSGDFPFWKLTLLGFCDGLYQLLSALYPTEQFHLAGDKKSWVEAGKMLVLPNTDRWCQLAGGGVEFYRSSEAHGIQIADGVVHTLYRANRAHLPRPGTEAPSLSNTDLTAKDFHSRLAAEGLWTNVSTSLSRIEAQVGSQS